MSFSRLIQLIGDETFQTITTKTVLIVGLGGVGGSAAEAIARSGFGHVILIDQDTTEESNLNRQLVSLHSTLGRSKVELMKERIVDINPNCKIDAHHLFYNDDTKTMIWDQPIDYVIDAIDTITYKIDLIKEATARNIPIISVMGTGNKYHPEQLAIMPLQKTEYDPIARVLRRKLRRTHNLQKIMVVASKEQPEKVDSHKQAPSSNAFVPNTAGIIAASYIFNQAIGKTT